MSEDYEKQTIQYLGYSPLFWLFGHFILTQFNNLVLLRLIFICCYIASIFLLYKQILKENKDKTFSFLGLLLLISTPISFYSNKIITPEFLQIILLTISLNMLLKEKNKTNQVLAWIIAGVGLGLKLHTLHFFGFLFLIKVCFLPEKNFKQIINLTKISAPFSFLGIMIANFSIITDYQNTIKSISSNSHTANFDVLVIIKTFFTRPPFEIWDCVLQLFTPVGMVMPSLLILGLVVFFLSIFTKQYFLGAIFIFSVLAGIIFTGLGSEMSWFHISYLPILISSIFWFKLPAEKSKKAIIFGLLFLAIGMNLVNSYQIISKNFKLRLAAYDEIKRREANTSCLNDLIKENKPNILLFGVVSYFNEKNLSYFDNNILAQENKSTNINGTLGIEPTLNEFKQKEVKIIYSNMSFLNEFNSSYKADNFINKIEEILGRKNIEITQIRSCGNISNFLIRI